MTTRVPRLTRAATNPIQIVARRTGLSAEVIRAWEKRYGVVTPVRASNGRRLYSERDVERLQLLAQATLTGRTIGQVAALPSRDLLSIARGAEGVAAGGIEKAPALWPKQVGVAARHVTSALEAIERFDVAALDAVLRRAIIALPAEGYLDEVIVPLWEQVAERTRGGSFRLPEWHLALTTIRRALFRLIDIALPSLAAPALVVTTPSGQSQELGALLSAAAAAADGWRVLNVGPGLPAEEIAAVVIQSRARAAVVSLGARPADRAIGRELRRLRSLLSRETPILVEGPAAASYRGVIAEIGAAVVRGLPDLRAELRELHETYASDGAVASPRE
ncbi:MAG TPA: MerR family transcriptional regulator [Gemmatimonadaceae bacterium]|nr:MerR family transcriptional regulator [Gemmatimonadaceae bacterium]